MTDWSLVADELIKSEPGATKMHDQVRSALAAGDTKLLREKVTNLKRLYPSTDWDKRLGIDELETKRLGKMEDTRRADIERAMDASLAEDAELDRLDDAALTNKQYTTEDGWKLYEQPDRSLTDHPDPSQADLSWRNLEEYVADSYDDMPLVDDSGKRLSKAKLLSEALRGKGWKVVKGGMKAMAAIPTPVTAAIGAAGFALDAKDAYALTESTMNPKTPEDVARQKMLADLMRRNELP